MASKKQLRTATVKTKKQKKQMKKSILVLVITVLVGFLVFFFLTLFDYVYPPVGGQGAGARKKEKMEVVVYFSDANERFLTPEKRYVPKEDEPEGLARELVKTLLDGSRSGLVNTFPDKVEVLGVKIDDGTAKVSFNRNLPKNHPGGSASEMATIYSLTNTLTENIPAVKRVKILIAGKEIESLKGHIDTRQAFVPNRELIVQTRKEQ
ncbi:MAG: GerMN domain-containing protein [Syntrophobacterales bacterium]|nr:GerMN domain-containing protein [Syntrophobacterales bacterium]